MSNKTTLQTNNNKLSANNTNLASILNTINSLPEAGSGGSGGSQENINVTFNISFSSGYSNATIYTFLSLYAPRYTENGLEYFEIESSGTYSIAKDQPIFMNGGHNEKMTDFYLTDDMYYNENINILVAESTGTMGRTSIICSALAQTNIDLECYVSSW